MATIAYNAKAELFLLSSQTEGRDRKGPPPIGAEIPFQSHSGPTGAWLWQRARGEATERSESFPVRTRSVSAAKLGD
jgi:hypothetical protein